MFSLGIHFPSRPFHFFLFRSKFRKSCVHVQILCALLVGTFQSLRFFLLRKQWVQSGFKQFQSGLWKDFSTKDSVFSCYARFISTEFGITRIFQREHRSYQKKMALASQGFITCVLIFPWWLGDSKELKFFGRRFLETARGSGFKQFQTP